MTSDVLEAVWTWVPLALSLGVFLGSASCRGRSLIAAAVVFADVATCAILSRALAAASEGTDFSLTAALTFGSVDYTAGMMMLALGEPVLAAVFGLSVINHGAFAVHMLTTHVAVTQDDYIAAYQSSISYGWISFALTILPALVIAGGGRGGGRRNRLDRNLRSAGRWRLDIQQGVRSLVRQVRR